MVAYNRIIICIALIRVGGFESLSSCAAAFTAGNRASKEAGVAGSSSSVSLSAQAGLVAAFVRTSAVVRRAPLRQTPDLLWLPKPHYLRQIRTCTYAGRDTPALTLVAGTNQAARVWSWSWSWSVLCIYISVLCVTPRTLPGTGR